MKPSYEWDEQQVLRLITDQVEESSNLDYKASASLQKTEDKKRKSVRMFLHLQIQAVERSYMALRNMLIRNGGDFLRELTADMIQLRFQKSGLSR